MTDAEMPGAEDLRRVPAHREIVSFRLALDGSGRIAALKAVTEGGRTEVMLLAAPVALHIRDTIRATLRARPGLAQLPTDNGFFRRQPAFATADWHADSPHVGQPLGAHVETVGESCVLAFPLDREGHHTAYRLRALYAAYLMHAINHLEENEGFGAAPAASGGTGEGTGDASGDASGDGAGSGAGGPTLH